MQRQEPSVCEGQNLLLGESEYGLTPFLELSVQSSWKAEQYNR